MSGTHFSMWIQRWCLFHDRTTLFGNYFRNVDIEHIIYVRDSFFNVNSTVMFVSWSDYLIWQLFQECWYRAYHICPGLIFQYEFNDDVCFMIGLPYLAIILGMLIWSILYMSGTHFLVWIQRWCLFRDQTALFGNYFGNAWYGIYHICSGLIFQYEFNSDVCVVIGLPYLVILTNAIIGVSKTTLAYSIWYISGLRFSSWIWIWSQNVNISFVSYVRTWFV